MGKCNQISEKGKKGNQGEARVTFIDDTVRHQKQITKENWRAIKRQRRRAGPSRKRERKSVIYAESMTHNSIVALYLSNLTLLVFWCSLPSAAVKQLKEFLSAINERAETGKNLCAKFHQLGSFVLFSFPRSSERNVACSKNSNIVLCLLSKSRARFTCFDNSWSH